MDNIYDKPYGLYELKEWIQEMAEFKQRNEIINQFCKDNNIDINKTTIGEIMNYDKHSKNDNS